jgi:pentatricopeptide repeat protein
MPLPLPQQKSRQQPSKKKKQPRPPAASGAGRTLDDYNRELKALSMSSSRDRSAAYKAEQLLQQMKKCNDNNVQPNQLSYTNVIVAWSRSKDHKAAYRAQALLDEIVQLYSGGGDEKYMSMQPSKVPYTAVIAAWSKSRDWNAGQRALTLLQQMKAYGTTFCSPNAMTYSACITALSGQGQRKNDNNGGAEVALKLLDECQERFATGDATCRPDTVVYTAVISTLAKSNGDYHEQAQGLLQEMEQAVTIDASSSSSPHHLKPNHFTYSAAMLACLDRTNATLSLERARSLLHHVQGRYKTGASDIAPNVVLYNSLLDVCSQCASLEAADLALTILKDSMSSTDPDCISYCTAMAAVTKSGNPECGAIAVELLRDMQRRKQQNQHQLQPNTFVYGAAISAQAKYGDATTAQALFDEMQESSVQPNTIVFNSLISAYARAAAGDDASSTATMSSAMHAHALWQEMYRRYHDENAHWVKPNTVTYNTVLGGLAAAASSSLDDEEGSLLLSTAQAMIDDMKRRTSAGEGNVKPDSVTYSTLIGMLSIYPGLEASQRVEGLLQEMTSTSRRPF